MHRPDDPPLDAGRADATKQVVAMKLLKAGDLVVDTKSVLAWLLGALGAPPVFAGLLLPIRESDSMLQQASLVPLVEQQALRNWVWVAGGGLQALSALAMAPEVSEPTRARA